MRILAAFCIACLFALSSAPAAQAEFVAVTKVSESSLKATCEKVGGTFASGGGGYSCENKCTGGVCAVYCNNKDEPCTGTTPGRIQPMQASIGEILAFVLQGGGEQGDPVVRSPRGDAVGSMSSQSSSTQGGAAIIY